MSSRFSIAIGNGWRSSPPPGLIACQEDGGMNPTRENISGALLMMGKCCGFIEMHGRTRGISMAGGTERRVGRRDRCFSRPELTVLELSVVALSRVTRTQSRTTRQRSTQDAKRISSCNRVLKRPLKPLETPRYVQP